MMTFRHGTPLHLQVAGRLRDRLIPRTPVGTRLPSDGELARQWRVSVRTVREALLLLEAEGLVERRRGSGTWVCQPRRRPIALFCELNVLDPATPRFFGLVLDLMRQRLLAAGHPCRIYTGRSRAGDPPGFTCPELIADADAGELAGVLAITGHLRDPRLLALRRQGLPFVTTPDERHLPPAVGIQRIPALAVPYLIESGRRNIALIGWDRPGPQGEPKLLPAFRQALEAHGADFHPEWARVEMSFAWSGSGWEEFREIWFAHQHAKPDALIITDENFLPEVLMSVLQQHLHVPRDLLVVSHQSKSIAWSLPAPIATIEQDTHTFADYLIADMLAALDGLPQPGRPDTYTPYRLRPLEGAAARAAGLNPANRMNTP